MSLLLDIRHGERSVGAQNLLLLAHASPLRAAKRREDRERQNRAQMFARRQPLPTISASVASVPQRHSQRPVHNTGHMVSHFTFSPLLLLYFINITAIVIAII